MYGTPGLADQVDPCCRHKGHDHTATAITEIYPDFEDGLRKQGQTAMLEVSSIAVFRMEEEVELGFDPSAYLPAGFDPYAGKIATWVDLGLVEVEEEPIPDLGFDTAPYLPEGFDPYAGRIATWVDLGLLEVDEEPILDLGFDTAPYLPAGFDPYEGMAQDARAVQ